MKTIMYIVIFAAIAATPKFYQPEKIYKLEQKKPEKKVDSLINIADKVEKKIDEKIMTKISNNNNELDSLKQVIKRQNIEIRKYKKLLKHGK